MDGNIPVQEPQSNKIHLTQKSIIFVIGVLVFFASLTTICAYYLGRLVALQEINRNSVTPTIVIAPVITQTAYPTAELATSCQTDSDCPTRQGCFLYQCFSGECRTINMCNQE